MSKLISLLLVVLLLGGCAVLRPGEDRKITAWGLWYAGPGGIIGLGYWHSERGDQVKSEQSAQPPAVRIP